MTQFPDYQISDSEERYLVESIKALDSAIGALTLVAEVRKARGADLGPLETADALVVIQGGMRRALERRRRDLRIQRGESSTEGR